MRLVDVHCHYEDPQFAPDLDEILADFPQKGVVAAISAGCTAEYSRTQQALAHRYPYVYFCAGIHPQDAATFNEQTFADVLDMWNDEKCVGAGEIGLDYYWESNPPREVQLEAFIAQACAARDRNFPVEIHCRNATGDVLDVIKREKISCGIVHCFSGSRETAKEILDAGLSFSFGGTSTFKNARKAIENLEYIPRDRVMLETDSPYLAPEPVRGTRNDSRNLVFIAENLAKIWNMTPDEVAELTTANAAAMFKIKV